MPAIHVEGLKELSRAFKAADAALNKDLRTTLREVAEPVRSSAETLAVARIPRIGLPWSRMRVGVTTHSVYIAPRRRGTQLPQRKRPNLAELLLGRSMLPALDANEPQVIQGMENLLERVGKAWEDVPNG